MGTLIDLAGQRFGYLTVLYRTENKIIGHQSCVMWHCKCDCGNECDVSAANLRKNYTKSCGCQSHGKRVINEIGNKYGKLTVVERVGSDTDHKALWKCKCECGGEVITTGKRLRSGAIQSCGCLKSSGERKISEYLTNNQYNYKKEQSFNNLYSEETNTKLRYDFALYKNKNIIGLIEFHGEQHYINTPRGYYTEEKLNIIRRHDILKEQYAINNNIPLLILNNQNYSEEKLQGWLDSIYGTNSFIEKNN